MIRQDNTPISSFRGVQALRAASALIVVAFHACHWFNRDADSTDSAPELQLVGDLCVWTFFLISGFVVMHVVDSGRESRWTEFALRRATRVLPLAWTMTAVKVCAALLTPALMFDGALTPARIISSFALVPTRDPAGDFRTLWGVEWTLVFEVAFYALVAVAMAARADPLRVVLPVLVVMALASVWRPPNGSVLWFYADPVVLFIAVGMLAARAVRSGRRAPVVRGATLCAIVFTTVSTVRGDLEPWSAGSCFLGLTALFLTVVGLERRTGRRIPRWVVSIGDASFAIYLTHPLVAQAAPRLLGAAGISGVPWWVVVAISIAASLLLGMAVHRWLDMPLHRFLRRVIARRPSTATPAPR